MQHSYKNIQYAKMQLHVGVLSKGCQTKGIIDLQNLVSLTTKKPTRDVKGAVGLESCRSPVR